MIGTSPQRAEYCGAGPCRETVSKNTMNRDFKDRNFRDRDRRDKRDSREREELYSQQVSAGKRKYFFDVKATKGGDKFVTISESRKMFDNDSGTYYFDRNRIFIYKEDIENFRTAFDNALHFIDTGEKRETTFEEYCPYDDRAEEREAGRCRCDEMGDAPCGGHAEETTSTSSENDGNTDTEFDSLGNEKEEESRSADNPTDDLADFHINEI